MPRFTPIYAMTKGSFFRMEDEPLPTIAEVLSGASGYMIMPTVEAKDVEDVYEILNIRHPDYFVAYVNELAKIDVDHTLYPRLHTSLSVGDIVVEVIGNVETGTSYKYLFCDNCGWKELA